MVGDGNKKLGGIFPLTAVSQRGSTLVPGRTRDPVSFSLRGGTSCQAGLAILYPFNCVGAPLARQDPRSCIISSARGTACPAGPAFPYLLVCVGAPRARQGSRSCFISSAWRHLVPGRSRGPVSLGQRGGTSCQAGLAFLYHFVSVGAHRARQDQRSSIIWSAWRHLVPGRSRGPVSLGQRGGTSCQAGLAFLYHFVGWYVFIFFKVFFGWEV